MKILRVLLAVASIVSLAFSGHAATFTANDGGLLGQTSTIGGSGADYASLKAAADDFSSYSGGAQFSYTFLIKTDLTEPASVAFGNATNGHVVTLKPDTGSSVTVTFTGAAANTGTNALQADLAIGTNSTSDYIAGARPTHGFVIDGSNNGTDSRNLTLIRETSLSGRHLISIVGDTDGVVVKNVTAATATTNGYTVYLIANVTAGLPDNARIENNQLRAQSTSGGQVIYAGSLGVTAPAAGNAIQGLVITGNEIIAGLRGVFLNFNGSVDITNNTFVGNSGTGYHGYGIFQNASNDTTGWTLNIAGNRFISMTSNNVTAGQGFTGVSLATPPVAPNAATYNITNNMFGGFKMTGATSSDMLYRGIVIGGGATAVATYNILHNSLNMQNFPINVASPTVGRLVGIDIVGSGVTTEVNLRNNIIRYAQAGGIAIRKSSASTLFSSSNNIFVSNGAVLAREGSTNYADLAAWQGSAAGRDTGSISVDPQVEQPPATGNWISDSDLHFDAYPGAIYNGTPAGILTDIDGETRSLTAPLMGADEVSPTSTINEWSLF